MKIKPGANIQGINIVMRPVLVAADAIWKELGQELVITSGFDGEHSAGSFHYYGCAVDLRTYYFTNDEAQRAAIDLQIKLGDKYDVIRHSTHIHVEYDPEV
jgi:hypothetical protein